MSILDSEYFYDVYCSKRADECKSLQEALSCYCSECDSGHDIVRYYVERHDKDSDFENQVDWLGYPKIALLLTILSCTSYDIFKPWCKRQYLGLMHENDEDLTDHERYWKRRITCQYDIYQKTWEQVDETLD